MDELLTVQQAADELGLSRRGVQNRIDRGEMQATRVGARVWVIARAEVERWRALGRQRPGRKRKVAKETGDGEASER